MNGGGSVLSLMRDALPGELQFRLPGRHAAELWGGRPLTEAARTD
jgi:hypothetical protein